MKKILFLIIIGIIILSSSASAETVYISYKGEIFNGSDEIWCVKQTDFELSTGTGFVEYDRGQDKCIASLILNAHKEPAEITSVDVAIKLLEKQYSDTIDKLEQSVKMKSFWIYFILIFGGMINIMFFAATVMVVYIYPNLRFR